MQRYKDLFRRVLAAVLSAALLIPGAVFAEESAQETDSGDFSISFPVDYDTYIRKGYGQEDYSTATDMIIDGRNSSERAGVLRFCYGKGATESVEAVAESANQVTLRVQVNQNAGAPNMAVYGVADDEMKNSWRDAGMNYDTAQELGILSARDTEAVPRLATVDMEKVSGAELLYIDVTDYVKAEAAKAAAGEEAVFVFLICGENALSSNDYFRIYGDNENGTSETRLPMLFAYSGHAGYATRDSMGLAIDKLHQVTEDFDLPAVVGAERGEEFASRIHWRSDTESVIRLEEDGDMYHAYVTQPNSSKFGDSSVILTATVQNGEEKRTKNFTLYVSPRGVFQAELTNYVSSSSKTETNPNSSLYTTTADGKLRNCAFVKFDASEAAFRYAPRIVLRLKPYYMSGSFTLTMTPLDASLAELCTDDMTWNSSEEAIAAQSPYSVTFTQDPSQTDWVEWDVTDYVHSVSGGSAVFRLEAASQGDGYCMFYGNQEKYLPQLKLYNYELAGDAEAAVMQAAAGLQTKLEAMRSQLLAVADNVTLPKVDQFGVTAHWQALSESGEPSEYLAPDGTLLSQPAENEENAKVRLVATLSREDYSGAPVTVSADAVVLRQVSDAEAIRYNEEHLALDGAVLTGSGSLPKGLYGADVTWSAEPEGVVAISGGSYSVTAGADAERSVVLVANISKGDAVPTEKRFPVIVLRDKSKNLIYARRPAGGAAGMELANDDDAQTHFASDADFSLQYALPSEQNINAVLVAPYQPENIREIAVFGSVDGTGWRQLAGFEEIKDVCSLRFDSTAVSHIRFDISVSGYAGIAEAGVYFDNSEAGKTAQSVVEDKDFADFAGIPKQAVSQDFALADRVNGARVSWTSSDERILEIVETDGSLTARVSQAEKSKTVTLTARVSLNGTTAQRSFTVTVSARRKGNGSGGGGGGGKYTGTGTVATSPLPAENELDQEEKPSFRDLDQTPWAQEAVYALQLRGIINGRSQNEFVPNDTVTREEFTKMLVLAVGLTPGGSCGFSDVDANAWHRPYIAVAVSAGLVQGMADDCFGTGKNVTREDAAVMLSRALEYCGVRAEGGEPAFVDADGIAPYAREAAAKLASLEMLSGDENGAMNPKKNATRAEAAKLIYMMTEKIS